MDIADALQAKGYEIDRKRIVLRDAIKETGEYTVKVKLHREVTLEVPVAVTPEGGEVVEDKKDKKQRKEKAESKEARVEAPAEAVAKVAEEVTEEVIEEAAPEQAKEETAAE
jgi:large subunit ribosomal protein L9